MSGEGVQARQVGKTILRQQRQKKTVALPPNGSSAGQGQGAPLKSYGKALLQVFSIRHQPHQVKLDLIEKALMGERREDRKMGGATVTPIRWEDLLAIYL
jgi:hypothetical protein